MNAEPIWSSACRDYEPTLRGHLAFELLATFGRLFLYSGPPDVPGDHGRLLNLGCGARPLSGWVNADFFRTAFWRNPADFWALDLRRPLRCPDARFDGAFVEHALEHLAPWDARNLLAELARTLRPGGWVRVIVPDVARYVAYYRGELPDPRFAERWPRRADALRALTQNYGHRSVWDAEVACAELTHAGFTDVREVAFGVGTDPRLLVDSHDRRWESLYVEGRKG